MRKQVKKQREGVDLEYGWVRQPWVGREMRRRWGWARGARKAAHLHPIYNAFMSWRNVAAL